MPAGADRLPALKHRVVGARKVAGFSTDWVTRDERFVIGGRTGSWEISSNANAAEADWLDRVGLRHARFETRKEALRALVATLDACPPQEPALVPLRRVSAGRWRTADGRWAIGRGRDRWSMRPLAADNQWLHGCWAVGRVTYPTRHERRRALQVVIDKYDSP